MNTKQIQQIQVIWDSYIKSDKEVLDIKGRRILRIDSLRENAIIKLKKIIEQFYSNDANIYEFKTNIDSYNKRNNYWGFTATKGQMFFNQLVKNSESKIELLTTLLKEVIAIPRNLNEALSKIEKLEIYCKAIFDKAKDKRKVPNPGSVGYYLSYFWQIHDHSKWPVLYTSLINSFEELDLWEVKRSQKETYHFFFNLNEDIKEVLETHSKTEISNWDAEHAFWNFKGNPNKGIEKKSKKLIKNKIEQKIEITQEINHVVNPSFELSDYLIPKVAKLIDLGNETEKSSAKKGSDYEKLVAEIFNQLDFEVEFLGQGKGRNPDAIIKLREENTAFIVDAKAYTNGYSLGIDDRAIKEYINHYCPKLKKGGYKKIGFIIVSNSFKSNFDSFINEITWDTDIKRFILLSSEALLYLLAYKTKDRLSPSLIIESLIGFSNPVIANNIIEEFDDI